MSRRRLTPGDVPPYGAVVTMWRKGGRNGSFAVEFHLADGFWVCPKVSGYFYTSLEAS